MLICQGQMAWAALIKWSREMVHITSRSYPNNMFQQFVKLQEDRLHSSIAARGEAGSWSAECPSTDQSCQSDRSPVVIWRLDSRDKIIWIFAYGHQLIFGHAGKWTYHTTSWKISILLCLHRWHHVSVNYQLIWTTQGQDVLSSIHLSILEGHFTELTLLSTRLTL